MEVFAVILLRDYQQRIIDKTRETLQQGFKRAVIVAPCGSGKTIISAAIIKMAVEKGHSVLYLAPRRELIYQTAETFENFRIRAGIIMAGESLDSLAKVQIASFDTLHARAIRRQKMDMPQASLVCTDEAHLAISKGKLEILNKYKDSTHVSFTATPCRGDGTGLGEFYDSLVNEVSVRELIDQGYLVEPEYYAPTEFDLSGVKQTKSDYIVSSLEKAVDKSDLIGDIYENWKRIAEGKRTVIFCTTRKHSRHVRDKFLDGGVLAEHVDAETPKDERKGIFDRIRSGETTVLCNVFVASYGLDIPPLEVAVLARPTKNLGLYVQCGGRILRPFPGKDKATIIDHTGAVERFGFLDDPIPWSLDGKDIREAKKKEAQERGDPVELTCLQCGTVFAGQRDCPGCGFSRIPETEDIPFKKADLVKVKRKLNKDSPPAEKAEFYGMLKHYGRSKGYKPAWSSNQYKKKFGVWPNKYTCAEFIPPSPAVIGWVKSKQIAYFAMRKKHATS